jgi:choline kinase
MQLILLAAGKGTRLPNNFRKNPKCMAKINKKTILEHNLSFYKRFKNRIIITGYKSNKLNQFITKNNFKEIKNKEYASTNMVNSLFKSKKLINNQELVICYTDIIFDKKIYNNLSNHKNKNLILLKKNWLEVWNGRMTKSEILNDAEDVKIKKNILISIGEKIKKTLPKYQYMGIIKLEFKDFMKLKNFYKKLHNKKIDFTSFLNEVLKKKIIKLNISITKKFWYEIDNAKDIKFTSKSL